VKIVLEIVGGFTGPAGKQVIKLDLDRLSERAASESRRDLKGVPENVWGASLLAPHPKPWDFRNVLRVEEGGTERNVTFHRSAAPTELTRLADRIIKLDTSG
jgi:hypothetical protein